MGERREGRGEGGSSMPRSSLLQPKRAAGLSSVPCVQIPHKAIFDEKVLLLFLFSNIEQNVPQVPFWDDIPGFAP